MASPQRIIKENSMSLFRKTAALLLSLTLAASALAEAGPAGAAPVRVREAYPELKTLRFAEPRLAQWNLPTRGKDVLKDIILSGRYDAGPAATLAAWQLLAEKGRLRLERQPGFFPRTCRHPTINSYFRRGFPQCADPLTACQGP